MYSKYNYPKNVIVRKSKEPHKFFPSEWINNYSLKINSIYMTNESYIKK